MRKAEAQANPEEKPLLTKKWRKKPRLFTDYINKIDLDDFGKHKSS